MPDSAPPDIDAIRARADAATDGPWSLHSASTLYMDGHAGYYLRQDGRPGQIVRLTCYPADAEFIAHAREDVPTLLTEIIRLQETVAGLDLLRRHSHEANNKVHAHVVNLAAVRDELRADLSAANATIARVRELAEEWRANGTREPTDDWGAPGARGDVAWIFSDDAVEAVLAALDGPDTEEADDA